MEPSPPAASRIRGTPPARLRAAAASASELMHRASDVVRHEAQALSEQTGRYVRDEPMKSLAIAAGIGAALAGLVALMAMWRTR